MPHQYKSVLSDISISKQMSSERVMPQLRVSLALSKNAVRFEQM